MNSTEILKYLEKLSTNNLLINILMHVIVISIILNLLFNKNVIYKTITFHLGILTLSLSVTIHAFIYGNPFHLITFLFLTIVMFLQIIKGKKLLYFNMDIWSYVAFIFILIGFTYPEFIKKDILHLIFASPVGIIPCPSLITILGLLILVKANKDKYLYISTIVLAAIYAIIGVFVLKVYLDIVLFLEIIIAIYIIVRKNECDNSYTVENTITC